MPGPDWWQRGTAIGGLVSVLLVAVGLYLTNSFNRDQLRAQRDSTSAQQALALKGQRADRFVAAVDQLGQEGANKLSIRLGGIYALETLMRDAPDDENTVIEVLCAFVRTHAAAPETSSAHEPDSPADIRAAVSVLGRRPDPGGHANLDLSNTRLGLHSMRLAGADLRNADLGRADLSGADLHRANLSGAVLYRADLHKANLSGAVLYRANLSAAVLYGADLIRADMSDADLGEADLSDADLGGAQLGGAQLGRKKILDGPLYLPDADLRNANLVGANLSGAVLDSDQLACSRVDGSTQLPVGVMRPAGVTPPASVKRPDNILEIPPC